MSISLIHCGIAVLAAHQVPALERNLTQLIASNQIPARIDSANKVSSRGLFSVRVGVDFCVICVFHVLLRRLSLTLQILYARHADQRNATFQQVLFIFHRCLTL